MTLCFFSLQDVQYADIDHMHKQMDFTINNVNFSGLPEYFNHLRDGGMRTIIILVCTVMNLSFWTDRSG